jgi:threonine synthase
MKELGLIDRVPRLAGIQAAAADPLYLSYRTGFEKRFTVTASPTLASAIRIGDPVSRDKASAVIMKTGGVVGEVSEEELMEAKMLADRSGIAVCPNSGVALAGLRKLRASGTIGEGESVVVVLTAHGAKFSQTGVDYHTGRMERPKNPCPNAPVSLPADYKAVVRAMGLARD